MAENWQQHKTGEAETTTEGNDEIKVDNGDGEGIDVRLYEKRNPPPKKTTEKKDISQGNQPTQSLPSRLLFFLFGTRCTVHRA
jgi:hypothetical protein